MDSLSSLCLGSLALLLLVYFGLLSIFGLLSQLPIIFFGLGGGLCEGNFLFLAFRNAQNAIIMLDCCFFIRFIMMALICIYDYFG